MPAQPSVRETQRVAGACRYGRFRAYGRFPAGFPGRLRLGAGDTFGAVSRQRLTSVAPGSLNLITREGCNMLTVWRLPPIPRSSRSFR